MRQWYASDTSRYGDTRRVVQHVLNGLCRAASYDVYHVNSAEPGAATSSCPYRHLDAAYRVSGSDGNVVWKLGGTARPESLTILNDPEFVTGSGFGGQHDARVLSDGTVTIFDNGFHQDPALRHGPERSATRSTEAPARPR